MQSQYPGIKRLVELETLKTWSLIVTLFGDLNGEELTGGQIRSLIGHIGIRPEAIRTALYRLKSDGWIISEKRGREALYKLSHQGREQTEAVTANIYGQSGRYPDGWQFVYQKDIPSNFNGISLCKDLYVVPVLKNTSTSSDSQQCLTLNLADKAVPEWFLEQLVPEPVQRNAKALIDTVSNNPAIYTGQDALVVRLLVLHHWRKLALRPGSWAHMWFDSSGLLKNCQYAVTSFLHDTPRTEASLIQ